MGFFHNTSVIRRVVVYGVSVLLLLVVLTRARGFGQSGPQGRASLLTFDGLQHALLGDTKKAYERDSALALRNEATDGNGDQGNSIHDKQVVYAAARDIPAHDDAGRPNYVPGQLIVRFRGGVSHHRQDEIVDELGARILRTLDAHRGEYLVVLSGGVSVPSAAQQFAALQEIDLAEPNVLHYINDMPSDSLYTAFDGQSTELQRWYFNGIGTDRNLNAEAAWNITTGSSNIVIAVIDTGVAINHPDLAANIWTNPGDDSSDGYTNDVHGWDFYNGDNDPNPDLGDGVSGDGNVFHGTFVAGVAAAVSDNDEGVVGASWHSKIMPLKVFTNTGGAPATAIAEAIHYAIDHHANVINMSFGSPVPTKVIASALQEASAKGIILVAAAGNNDSNRRSYPASYPGVISVGGTGSGSVLSGYGSTNIQGRASFSEFGPKAVDVVAPAVDIVSTAVLSMTDQAKGEGKAGDFSYFYGNGTSFSSPLVAGEAALLLARAEQLGLDGSISASSIEDVIVNATTPLGADPTALPDAGPNWANHGRVDFLAAVQQIGPALVTAPKAPLKMSAQVVDPGVVELNWVDGSGNEQGFLIERAEKDGKTIGSFDVIAEVDHNSTNFTDDSVASGVTYAYRVAAFNVAATNSVRKAATVTMP
ncbi:MAG TPA: S8 family serine peptidase [Verrucomicrobiae bacterium]|nr:S8 family serine peptidase [Verrucomicrobiae bacterium]